MSQTVNFLGGLLQGFAGTQQRNKELEEEKKERKARVQLFELQMERAQREEREARKRELAQEQVFDKLRGMERMPGTGVGVMDPTAKTPSLTELLAEPESAMLLLKAGMVSPQALMQGQQEPAQIQLLRALQADPSLAEVDRNRRAAGAPSTTINLDNQGLSKPPTGYFRPNPQAPGLQIEPGGPVQSETAEKNRKAAGRAQSVGDKSDSVLTEIQDARSLASPMTVGFASDLTSGIKGTAAFDLAEKIKTIQANLGFDRLQEMREQSPTGGALGAVAVKELEGLQAGIASLNQGQSLRQFKKNLEKIEGHYSRWKKAVDDSLLPEGVPSGSTLIGTSNGNPVYQTPDGKKLVVEP